MDPWVELVHELKEFIHNCLEELPMGPQKAWILPNNIHDVGSNHSFVILAAGFLTQVQQIPYDCYQELILLLFVHRA